MDNIYDDNSKKLIKLYTGAITDIMDNMGSKFRNQALPINLRPLIPKMKVAGPVFPVRGNKRFYDDGKDPRYKQMDMLDGIYTGSVI